MAIMSSLPSGGVDMSTPTISPISDSVRRALGMSSRMSPLGLTALEQLAQRLGDPALEALGVGAHALAGQQHERVPDVHEGAYGASDAFLRRHFVDPGRRQPLHRRRSLRPGPARRAGPAGWGNSGRPWRGPPRPPRPRRSCSPALPAPRTSARRRRGSPRRRAAVALCLGAGSDIDRLVGSLGARLMRC